MAFYETNVHRSSSMSHVEDPGSEDLQGFIDDDPTHSLVSLGHRRHQLFFCDGKRLILTMGVFAVVGIAVGLGIIFSEAEAPSHNSKGTKANSAGDQNWLMDPPPVPGDLHVVCAPLNVQTDDGYNACLEMCQPAFCCDKISDSDLSCIDTHRKECERYRASCQHLGHVKATTPEVTAEQLCSTDSLMTVEGVEACSDVCESFKCCFDGSTDCDVSEALCSDNGACATALLVGPDGLNSHVEAKEAIEGACQDMFSYDGQTKCTHVCSAAVCCFLSPSAWKYPCSITCDHYETCSQLYGPILRDDDVDANLAFSVPHQVEQACNPSQLETVTGVRECFDMCQHHLCCFDELEAGGCLDTNKDECSLYSACRSLIDVQDSSEQPAEICEPKLVEQTGPGECMNVCAKSYCCLFDARFESSCANDQICSTYYKPCEILAPEKAPEEDADLVASIETVCTESNLQSVLGATECEKDCAERECCIAVGAGNCKTSDPQYCQEVQSCELLFQVDPTPEIDDPVEDHTDANVVTQKLESACSPDNLATLSGYHNCYDQCYYHLCCFNDNEYLNCKEDKGEEECNEYAPCQALLEASGEDSTNVVEACSSSSVETASGLTSCRNDCASHLCCFQDPNLPSSCVGWYGQRECDKYESCEVLVSDSSHAVYNEEDPYLVALIDNYCKPENIADEETARHCMFQCEKRGCCFLTGDCYESNKEWCDEVIACTNHPLINAPVTTTAGDDGSKSDEDDNKQEDGDPDDSPDPAVDNEGNGDGNADPVVPTDSSTPAVLTPVASSQEPASDEPEPSVDDGLP